MIVCVMIAAGMGIACLGRGVRLPFHR